MSGMTKVGTGAKLADSNIALLGSDLEKNVKKASAESEKEWKGCGKEVGLEIWRIESFGIKKWPKAKYGKFFDGDSYIILWTYKQEDKILYNVHFWLGEFTTQDEYGTAAYKTVELDTLLDDLPIQYREVQGSETELFQSYFDRITILKGGVESAFNHVEPEKYTSRLLRFKGKTKPVLHMLPLEAASLNQGDAFVLDAGLKVWQWNGGSAGPWEKKSANDYVDLIETERKDVQKTIIEAGDEADAEFWELLGGKADIKSADEGGSDKETEKRQKTETRVMKISISPGAPKEDAFSQAGEGKDLSMDVMNDGDSFIVTKGKVVFVWIGKGASKMEQVMAMSYAAQFIKVQNLPFGTSVVRIKQGQETEAFKELFPEGGEPKAAPPPAKSKRRCIIL